MPVRKVTTSFHSSKTFTSSLPAISFKADVNRSRRADIRIAASSIRLYSSLPDALPAGLRIRHAVGALMVFGVGTMAWGVYEIFSSFTIWPKELRGDLRSGLRAKYRGDLKLAQRYLARAWTTLCTLPATRLAPEAYLKASGLLITLADVFEEDKQSLKAYWMYALAIQAAGAEGFDVPEELLNEANKCLLPVVRATELSEVGTVSDTEEARPSKAAAATLPASAGTPLTHTDQLRLVALSLKLADMSYLLERPLAEEHTWLNLAVGNTAKVIADKLKEGRVAPPGKEGSKALSVRSGNEPDSGLLGKLELPLPAWLSFTGPGESTGAETFAAPYERIGAFYARLGHVEYALENYRYATILLDIFGGKDEASKTVNMCRMAQINNNSAKTLIRHYQYLQHLPPSPPSHNSLPQSSSDSPLPLPPSKRGDFGSAYNKSDLLEAAYNYAASSYAAAYELVDLTARTDKGASFKGKSTDMELWGLCANVLPVVAFNLGAIHEMRGDRVKARDFFKTSLHFSTALSFNEGMQEARAALRRMDREDRTMKGNLGNGVGTEDETSIS